MSKERVTILDNEKFLRQVSKNVDFNDKSYLDDIVKLKDFCKNDGIFALAPVQIGIPKRIIYIRNSTSDADKNFDSNYDEGKIYINPIIIKRKGLTKYLEGCASCPGTAPNKDSAESDIDNFLLVGTVKRPYLIEIEYYDIEGLKKKDTIEGFESTVFSHEYDHLNGILHLDLIEEVWNMDLKERSEYRKNHPYEIISENCDY
jgi:N-formylmethionyl-tRNA deformylase